MKRILIILAAMAMILPSCGQKNNKKSQVADENASVVYFTKDISPDGLIKIYEALGVEAKGRVAVKISTGESMLSNHLRP